MIILRHHLQEIRKQKKRTNICNHLIDNRGIKMQHCFAKCKGFFSLRLIQIKKKNLGSWLHSCLSNTGEGNLCHLVPTCRNPPLFNENSEKTELKLTSNILQGLLLLESKTLIATGENIYYWQRLLLSANNLIATY